MRIQVIDGILGVLQLGEVFEIGDYELNKDADTYYILNLGQFHKSHFKIKPYLFQSRKTKQYAEYAERPSFVIMYPSGEDQQEGESWYNYELRKGEEAKKEFYAEWEEINFK